MILTVPSARNVSSAGHAVRQLDLPDLADQLALDVLGPERRSRRPGRRRGHRRQQRRRSEHRTIAVLPSSVTFPVAGIASDLRQQGHYRASSPPHVRKVDSRPSSWPAHWPRGIPRRLSPQHHGTHQAADRQAITSREWATQPQRSSRQREPATAVRERVLVMGDGFRLPLMTWEPVGHRSATVIGAACLRRLPPGLRGGRPGPGPARLSRPRLRPARLRRHGRPRALAWLAPAGARPARGDQDAAAARRLAHVPPRREHGRRRGAGRHRPVPARAGRRADPGRARGAPRHPHAADVGRGVRHAGAARPRLLAAARPAAPTPSSRPPPASGCARTRASSASSAPTPTRACCRWPTPPRPAPAGCACRPCSSTAAPTASSRCACSSRRCATCARW